MNLRSDYFNSGCTIFSFPSSAWKFCSPRSLWHLLFLLFSFSPSPDYYSHPSGFEVISHCSFDFSLLNDQWCWTSLCVYRSCLWRNDFPFFCPLLKLGCFLFCSLVVTVLIYIVVYIFQIKHLQIFSLVQAIKNKNYFLGNV